MNKHISERRVVPIAKATSAAGLLLDRKSPDGNRIDVNHILKQASRCRCGAHNVWLRGFYYASNTTVGIICIKCRQTSIGANLQLALSNWEELNI